MEIAQKSQRQDNDIDAICNRIDQLCSLTEMYYGKVKELYDRVEALEKMIVKVPEFYEYWKKLNACGYQD